jgi:hypothetical protein
VKIACCSGLSSRKEFPQEQCTFGIILSRVSTGQAVFARKRGELHRGYSVRLPLRRYPSWERRLRLDRKVDVVYDILTADDHHVSSACGVANPAADAGGQAAGGIVLSAYDSGEKTTRSIARTNHIGPKTSVKDRQIRCSLENCCASASDPKIKLRRISLLRTHSSPRRPHEQHRRGHRDETAWSKRQKRNLCLKTRPS